MSDILVLHLKKQFYDAITAGHKTVEYRDLTDYWLKRITRGKQWVHFYCGYPPKGTPPLIRKIKRVIVNVESIVQRSEQHG